MAASGEGTGAEADSFHAPSLGAEFLNIPFILFGDGPTIQWLGMEQPIFGINRIILVRLIAIAVMLVLFVIAFAKPRVVPGKGQQVAELALGWVRDTLVYDVMGEKLGKKYFPFIASIFFAVFAMNVTGIVPGLNIAGTALIGMPIVLALCSYVVMIYAGVRDGGRGGLNFLRNSLFPPGVPLPFYLIITPIEFVNTFVVRPVSLALRLFMNMMVGHLLLVLCWSATHFFIFTAGGWFSLFGIPTVFGGLIISAVEMLAAVLQALVFALLTSAFIQLSAAEEH